MSMVMGEVCDGETGRTMRGGVLLWDGRSCCGWVIVAVVIITVKIYAVKWMIGVGYLVISFMSRS